MFSAKLHTKDGETLLACCDITLLGKKLEDEDLSLHISETFFGGEIVDEKKLIDLMTQSTMANIFGDNVVDVLASAGYISESSVANVCGVKHAQLYVI
ncbi:MAG: DUF424 family protein [Candidatus Altiarchaeota archaeon]|nr:DUF424 family protein [Candidatus Altiarchaeota archaeon]